MVEDPNSLLEQLEHLRAERQALEAEVSWLRECAEAEASQAEAVLEELLGETPSTEEPRGGQDPEESRRRLLAVREALRARERRVLEVQRQKDEVLSLVAHDLRTPLVAIQGFAQLLGLSAQRSPLTVKQGEYVERILQAVRTMNRLVEDLLTARQLERGSLPLRLREVAVAGFVEELLELHREASRQKGVGIDLAVSPESAAARFDPDRIAQALGNLVQNAVKFTPEGGRVRVAVVASVDLLRFEVVDQGPGVEPSLLPRLFDRFTQGRIAMTSGRGYGLGLSICRDLAALHGGRVGAENRPEGGSRFWIELPAGGPPPAEKSAP